MTMLLFNEPRTDVGAAFDSLAPLEHLPLMDNPAIGAVTDDLRRTTALVLRLADALVRVPSQWCQGPLATDAAGEMIDYADDRAKKFCALGALSRAWIDSGASPWRPDVMSSNPDAGIPSPLVFARELVAHYAKANVSPAQVAYIEGHGFSLSLASINDVLPAHEAYPVIGAAFNAAWQHIVTGTVQAL